MTTNFRALVMLAVLVGLPGAWIYYGPLPAGAQRVVDRLVVAAKEAAGWEKPPSRESTRRELPAAPTWTPPATSELSHVVPLTPAMPSPALLQEGAAPSLEATMEPLLARLREFGAVEYVLERWGDSGDLYRFRCAIPLASSRDATRQFEAVAESPQSTIEQVVHQVASWRTLEPPAMP